MAALFLGGLLSVGFFATPQKKKTRPATQESRLRSRRGSSSSSSLLTWPSPKTPWVLSTLFVGRNFRGGEGSPENPWRKGELIHMNIGVKVMCLLICMHSKKRKIQSDNQKKQRDLNSKRDSRKWSNAKGFIPQKFSHDVIGTFMKASRHAWIIDVSNWCPQHF